VEQQALQLPSLPTLTWLLHVTHLIDLLSAACLGHPMAI